MVGSNRRRIRASRRSHRNRRGGRSRRGLRRRRSGASRDCGRGVLDAANPIQHGQPRHVQHRLHAQAVERVALGQARRQRQAAAGGEAVAQVVGGQRAHAGHQRAGVVIAAGAQGGFDEGIGGGLRVQAGFRYPRARSGLLGHPHAIFTPRPSLRLRSPRYGFRCHHPHRSPSPTLPFLLLPRLAREQRRDRLVAERVPHPVGQQHEDVAQRQLAVVVIHQQARLQPQRAAQHVAQLRVRPGVVLAQAQQRAVAPQVGARVAHVREVPAPPAQHQRGERGRHARSLGGTRRLREQPAVGRAEHGVERLLHAPGVGRGEVVGEQAAHGILRRLAAVRVATDAVGDRQQHALGRALVALGHRRGNEVLVGRARPGPAGVAEEDLQGGQVFHLLTRLSRREANGCGMIKLRT